MSLEELKKSWNEAGQGHVLQYYDELSKKEQSSLLSQLESFGNPSHLNDIVKKTLKQTQEDKNTQDIEPLPSDLTASTLEDTEQIKQWHDKGIEILAQSKVAVLLMAGGAGTRLGSSEPKGCYNIGLKTGKSLFQLQGERINKLQKLSKGSIAWYVMTSGVTHDATVDHFRKNDFFGLDQQNVVFFQQGVLPCFDHDNKIILDNKGFVANSGDGNGGLYKALIINGIIEDMERRGIEHIHAYCVDNCLVKVADPVFIGFGASKNLAIATKVVRKRSPKESVGLIVQKDGKPNVVEYSEISEELASQKEGDLLKLRAANIVNHYYSFKFLSKSQEWSTKLPYHVANKKIPYIDTKSGDRIKPEKPNGIKMELFVFDVFPFVPLSEFGCLEVKREDEFSPLKNAPGTGEDDPDTSRTDIQAQGARWVKAAGATVVSEDKDAGIEISPLISYRGEGLQFLSGKEIKAPAVIDKQ